MLSIKSLVLLAAAATILSAEPVTWTLNNVTSLGTTIAGTFVFDADVPIHSSIDITTTGGSVIPSTHWTVAAQCCDFLGNFVGLVDTTAANQAGADLLGLFLASPLTDAGGTINVTGTQQGTCAIPDCGTYNVYGNDPSGGINNNVTGTLTSSAATPEPSTWLLGISSLMLAGLVKRTSAACRRD